MYKITLKKREPLFVEDNDGLKIKEKWNDPKTASSFKFEVKGSGFSKGSIDYIDAVKERQGGNDPTVDANKEDNKLYLAWKVKTPQEKAERLAGFMQCFALVNLYEPKPELVALLKTTLVKFFTQNPDRTYADYNTYTPFLFKGNKKVPLTFAATVMIGIFARTLANDYQNAKYIK